MLDVLYSQQPTPHYAVRTCGWCESTALSQKREVILTPQASSNRATLSDVHNFVVPIGKPRGALQAWAWCAYRVNPQARARRMLKAPGPVLLDAVCAPLPRSL